MCALLLVCNASLVQSQEATPSKKKPATANAQAKKKAGNAQSKSAAKTLEEAGAKVEVYKQTVDAKGEAVELEIFIFNPENHKASDKRPAIVFFFGGGWRAGTPTQFTKQCQYLADRGMVAMTADYRVLTRQGTKPTACVSDGKSAVRWIRENAERLGIDPGKVAAGGGSAGGHVAACTGVIKTLDEPTENANISSKPDALVLFNPALVLAPIEGEKRVSKGIEKKLAQLEKRIGADPKTISPAHNISQSEPPTIIFHGKTDKTVPYATAEAFTKLMLKAGHDCELVGYDRQGHGFFNANRKNGRYAETVEEMDRFLVKLGFLTEKEK